MVAASAFLLAALLVLLVAEFLFVLLLGGLIYWIALGTVLPVLASVPTVAAIVGVGCYLGLCLAGYHAVRVAWTNSLEYEPTVIASEMGAALESARRRMDRRGTVAIVATVLALVVASRWLVELVGAELFFVPISVVVALIVVGSHFVHTVRAELSGDVAVLRTLDDSVHLSTDLERDPELEAIRRRVDRLARQADVPAPTVKIAVTRTPTALTVGYRPAESTIVLSRGLVKELDERELEAVLAHELAHVANRDAAIMSVMTIPAAKAEAFLERYDGAGYLGLLALLLQALSRWCVIAVARYREYVADDGAVAITGEPAALAGALETLDRSVARRPTTDLRRHRTAAAFSIVPPPWEEHRFFDRSRRFVARRLLGTHPPTKKRIERLRFETPDSATTGGQ
ncbi:M48 family metallopeptidase [Natronorubrum texcoconense]|uniref:Heat shock protein HtpX n=1 Tax=Natronorubrum texcoconense TaxID=1095776 RepID=A0A1G8WX16_9EURY|nr:M48 family metallopeptidase [Natronorubrum texcoconense]SDJ82165.1 heat shock protein HtpX [Natronorubrum texcoconense]